MRLTVLGSGDAFNGSGCNAAYLVDNRALVDCGAPVHVLVRRLAVAVTDIRLVLLTHFHADHSFMLPMVLGACAFGRSTVEPGLIIAGPVGTEEFSNRLLRDGYGSHILGLIQSVVQPVYVNLQDGSDENLAGYRVRAHAVVHSTGPSLAYTLTDASNTTIGFSGDSTLCPGLERAVATSDCFVSECTGWDGPVAGGHMWREEVEGLVRTYPETAFVISHLTERRELRGAVVAHDLLTLDIAPHDADTA